MCSSVHVRRGRMRAEAARHRVYKSGWSALAKEPASAAASGSGPGEKASSGSGACILDADLLFTYVGALTRAEQVEFARRIGSSVDFVSSIFLLYYILS